MLCSADLAVVHTPRRRSFGNARCVPAAVTEAGDVTYQNLVRTQRVAVGTAARGLGHPPAVGGPDELTFVHRLNRTASQQEPWPVQRGSWSTGVREYRRRNLACNRSGRGPSRI
jgi:hypothetical protein